MLTTLDKDHRYVAELTLTSLAKLKWKKYEKKFDSMNQFLLVEVRQGREALSRYPVKSFSVDSATNEIDLRFEEDQSKSKTIYLGSNKGHLGLRVLFTAFDEEELAKAKLDLENCRRDHDSVRSSV